MRKTAGTVDGMRTLSLLLAAVSCSLAVAQRMLAADAKRISQHTVSSLSPPHMGLGVQMPDLYIAQGMLGGPSWARPEINIITTRIQSCENPPMHAMSRQNSTED